MIKADFHLKSLVSHHQNLEVFKTTLDSQQRMEDFLLRNALEVIMMIAAATIRIILSYNLTKML